MELLLPLLNAAEGDPFLFQRLGGGLVLLRGLLTEIGGRSRLVPETHTGIREEAGASLNALSHQLFPFSHETGDPLELER